MASVVGIVGKSGAGKSTGIKYLNPETTLIINCDKKDLPFKGWRDKYNVEKKNYTTSSQPSNVKKFIDLALNSPTINTVVVDTMNAVMVDDEMKRMYEKGYDKWADVATAVYDIIIRCNESPKKDLVIFLVFHEESFLDEDGVRTTHILTNGKKLNKIQLETKMTTVLWAKVKGEDGKNEHWLETKMNNNTAKSPEGMFDNFKMPNNFEEIRKKVIEYSNN